MTLPPAASRSYRITQVLGVEKSTGRALQSSISLHGGATTAFTWDAGDRLTLTTDSFSGSITRTYDNRFDAAATEVAPLGTGNSTLTWTYDAAGRRTQTAHSGDEPTQPPDLSKQCHF